MSSNLPGFQRYQQAFTAYLRDPLHQPRPQGVVADRMAVYEEIVFNNIFESVSACFPVARKVVGKRNWLKITQAFLRDHAANTPIFRQIPEEFLYFLANANLEIQQRLPPFLVSLCHYEWIELHVASMATSEISTENINQKGDLLAHQPILTPTTQLLNYEYAVHKISPRYKPKEQVSTQLLVFRNIEDNVKFIELNPVTFRLITLLLQGGITGKQALILLTEELDYPQPASLIQFGLEILEELRGHGVILGTSATKNY